MSASRTDSTATERTSTGPVVADPISGPSALESALSAFARGASESETAAASLEGRVAENASAAVVIAAGGSGERFGNPGGKQLFEALGRPVLTWSAEAFDACPDVGLIVISCPDERREQYCREAIDPYPFVTPIEFASAGSVRQESVMNGIDRVGDSFEYIIVHDGARPLVTAGLVSHALNMLKGTLDIDGVVVGHPSVDTLKVVEDGAIIGTPDRTMFWVAQTPQVFRAGVLRDAYQSAMSEGFVGTDDSSLVERIGCRVAMFTGPRDNIKVTVPEDAGPLLAALGSRLAGRDV